MYTAREGACVLGESGGAGHWGGGWGYLLGWGYVPICSPCCLGRAAGRLRRVDGWTWKPCLPRTVVMVPSP